MSCAWLFAQHLAEAKSRVSTSARLELAKGPGTEQCLEQRALSHAVEARLRRRAFRADLPATLYVRITLTRNDAGWLALLTMHDGSGAFLGRRAITTDAADCSALDDSLALVVALLVDSPPAAALESSEPPPARNKPTKAAPETTGQLPPPTSTQVDAPTSQETPAISLPPDTPAPRAPWRWSLAAEGSGAIGVLPGFAPGVELGFGAKPPTLPELRLFGGIYAQRDQPSSRPGPESGAHFDLAYVGLELCPVEVKFGLLEWFACAGQSLGRLRVTSYGFDENFSSSHLTYALLVRNGLQLGLSPRWAARLGVRAELPLSRGVFTYGSPDGEQQELFEMWPVTAVLDLGLVVRL